tara:strand:+ start:270 stop:392 length:123 start_codon:yes stop_codon:yes gene_type:complete
MAYTREVAAAKIILSYFNFGETRETNTAIKGAAFTNANTE